MFNWIYHGKDKKQCYNEPRCLVCLAKAFFEIIIAVQKYGKGAK